MRKFLKQEKIIDLIKELKNGNYKYSDNFLERAINKVISKTGAPVINFASFKKQLRSEQGTAWLKLANYLLSLIAIRTATAENDLIKIFAHRIYLCLVFAKKSHHVDISPLVQELADSSKRNYTSIQIEMMKFQQEKSPTDPITLTVTRIEQPVPPTQEPEDCAAQSDALEDGHTDGEMNIDQYQSMLRAERELEQKLLILKSEVTQLTDAYLAEQAHQAGKDVKQSRLKKEHDSIQSQIERLTQSSGTLSQNKSEIEFSISEKTQKINKIKETLYSNKSIIDDHQLKKSSIQSDLEAYTLKDTQLQDELTSLQTDKKNKSNELKLSENLVKRMELGLDIKKLQNDIDTHSTESEKIQAKVKQYKASIQLLENDIHQLKTQEIALKQECASHEQSQMELTDEVTRLCRELDSNKVTIETLRLSLQKVHGSDTDTHANETQQQLQAKQIELAQAQERHDELKRQIATLEIRVNASLTDLIEPDLADDQSLMNTMTSAVPGMNLCNDDVINSPLFKTLTKQSSHHKELMLKTIYRIAITANTHHLTDFNALFQLQQPNVLTGILRDIIASIAHQPSAMPTLHLLVSLANKTVTEGVSRRDIAKIITRLISSKLDLAEFEEDILSINNYSTLLSMLSFFKVGSIENDINIVSRLIKLNNALASMVNINNLQAFKNLLKLTPLDFVTFIETCGSTLNDLVEDALIINTTLCHAVSKDHLLEIINFIRQHPAHSSEYRDIMTALAQNDLYNLLNKISTDDLEQIRQLLIESPESFLNEFLTVCNENTSPSIELNDLIAAANENTTELPIASSGYYDASAMQAENQGDNHLSEAQRFGLMLLQLSDNIVQIITHPAASNHLYITSTGTIVDDAVYLLSKHAAEAAPVISTLCHEFSQAYIELGRTYKNMDLIALDPDHAESALAQREYMMPTTFDTLAIHQTPISIVEERNSPVSETPAITICPASRYGYTISFTSKSTSTINTAAISADSHPTLCEVIKQHIENKTDETLLKHMQLHLYSFVIDNDGLSYFCDQPQNNQTQLSEIIACHKLYCDLFIKLAETKLQCEEEIQAQCASQRPAVISHTLNASLFSTPVDTPEASDDESFTRQNTISLV